MSLKNMKTSVIGNRSAALYENESLKLNRVSNFMGGNSYEVNPLLTLKLVSASSIFGEPQYYRAGEFSESRVTDGVYLPNKISSRYDLVLSIDYSGQKTSDLMETIIDESLSFDFEGTLRWAVELRNDYLMRLNPQVIMVRASVHPSRVEFNESNPGLFREIQSYVMSRADEPSVQFTYWLYRHGSKNGIPSILKRSWKSRYEKASAYEINKYKNSGVGIIDTVRVCHAHSSVLDSLLRGDDLGLSESELTWNQYISEHGSTKDSWEWVIDNLFTSSV